MNARFNVYINGQTTKLTLTPGQRLHHYKAYQTEEGWNSELEVWTHEGDHVSLYYCNDGVDCDGRLTREGELICPLDMLKAHEHEGEFYPVWEEEKHWQRDYYAEAMGY